MSLAAASPLHAGASAFAPRRLRARCAGARAAPRRAPAPSATAASAPLSDAHGRRAALVAGAAAAAAALLPLRANAVQGLVPGRIPGLGKEDAEGFRLYTRPEGKSGGHGVGWSEIPPYSFRVYNTWEEIPVSIADLGGAEVDLRFQDKDEGDISVVVAPVARFADIGFNASVRLQELVTPEQLISGFAPELIGQPLQEGDVLSQERVEKNGLLYYTYELKPRHLLVSATAFKNRLYILTASASPRQWRKADVQTHLRATADSFLVKNA